tara:strand:- start:54152 stop:55039 length:888 start_codon:yes stop_codon:yes gene_type:complete
MEINKLTKKGVVFSLDAAIAVTVIIIILINSAYYFSTSSKESLSQLQPVRIGSDILAILDYTGELETAIMIDPIGSTKLQQDLIDDVEKYLPANYEMKLSINDLQESIANKSIFGLDVDTVCPLTPLEEPGVCILKNKGDSINLTTFPIQTAGYYYLLTKTDNIGLPLNSITETLTATIAGETGTPQVKPIALPYYDLTDLYVFAGGTGSDILHYFNAGVNIITFTNNHNEPITLEWFKVLGDDSYALEHDITTPDNRFVGTGERIVAVANGNTFHGFYNVRYMIWLKSTISTAT